MGGRGLIHQGCAAEPSADCRLTVLLSFPPSASEMRRRGAGRRRTASCALSVGRSVRASPLQPLMPLFRRPAALPFFPSARLIARRLSPLAQTWARSLPPRWPRCCGRRRPRRPARPRAPATCCSCRATSTHQRTTTAARPSCRSPTCWRPRRSASSCSRAPGSRRPARRSSSGPRGRRRARPGPRRARAPAPTCSRRCRSSTRRSSCSTLTVRESSTGRSSKRS